MTDGAITLNSCPMTTSNNEGCLALSLPLLGFEGGEVPETCFSGGVRISLAMVRVCTRFLVIS